MLDEQSQSLLPSCTGLKALSILSSPSFSLLTDQGSWCGSIPTSAVWTPATPHPHIPARFPVPRHTPPQHPPPPPHSGLLHSRSLAPCVSPILPSPSSTPTRQAGGSVDPLEQLSGAQLSAEVGVRGLDGLAHAHLAGRRPLQLHGWSRVRSNRAWPPPGHQLGPPPLQRAPSRCPAPAPRPTTSRSLLAAWCTGR